MPEVDAIAEAAKEFALVRDFAIIMAVAGAAVVLFRKLNQPSILGYLLAGLLIGPFTLPIPPIPETRIESIRLLADLGLVLLLFAVGLEFGWRRIRQVGLGVLLIGSIEMMVMISVGYQAGRLLGWTALESIFLGSALSISSSAVLIKVLRDTGRLTSSTGKLIVGILVVEDFVAVVLLTLLSGVAVTGSAQIGDVGSLVAKLAIFAVASLTLGYILVPRIVGFVAQFRSAETMLLTSLALCFSLALIGQSLEISAAAGAFLIGAVVGDTEHSENVTRIIDPIRDMFGAVFFVSIGMLIDVRELKDHLVPALVVSLVFIVGKIVANTVGTFVTGRPGRTPLEVGMGMPQIGEFSLAIMKVGVESPQEPIRAFTYQVVAAVTAISSLAYPYIVRATEQVAGFLEVRSTPTLRRYITNLSVGLQGLRSGISFDAEFAHRIRGSSLTVLINFMIIVVLVGTGTLGVGRAQYLAELIGARESVVGSAIGFATLALCFPPAVAIWWSIQNLAEETTAHLILRRGASMIWGQETLRHVIRDSVMIFLIFLIGLWSVPFVSELLSLGGVAIPVPLVILAALVYVAVRTRLHGYLVEIFSRPFLAEPGARQTEAPPSPGRERHGTHPPVSEPEAVGPLAPYPSEASAPVVSEQGLGQGGRQVTIAEAEIIALSTVGRDRTPYRRRLGNKSIVWDIKSVDHSRGYYRVTLTFRRADADDTDTGEEELYLDLGGRVRLRQIRSWPAGGARRLPLPLLYVLSILVVAIGVGAGVFAFAQERSAQSDKAAVQGPTSGGNGDGVLSPGGAPPPGLTGPVSEATSTPTSTPAPTATPVAVNDSYVTNEDGVLTVEAVNGPLANDSDADGDTLSASLVATPTRGEVTLNLDGSFSYTPNAGLTGTDSFTYRASDGALLSNPATVAITVTPTGR